MFIRWMTTTALALLLAVAAVHAWQLWPIYPLRNDIDYVYIVTYHSACTVPSGKCRFDKIQNASLTKTYVSILVLFPVPVLAPRHLKPKSLTETFWPTSRLGRKTSTCTMTGQWRLAGVVQDCVLRVSGKGRNNGSLSAHPHSYFYLLFRHRGYRVHLTSLSFITDAYSGFYNWFELRSMLGLCSNSRLSLNAS